MSKQYRTLSSETHIFVIPFFIDIALPSALELSSQRDNKMNQTHANVKKSGTPSTMTRNASHNYASAFSEHRQEPALDTLVPVVAQIHKVQDSSEPSDRWYFFRMLQATGRNPEVLLRTDKGVRAMYRAYTGHDPPEPISDGAAHAQLPVRLKRRGSNEQPRSIF